MSSTAGLRAAGPVVPKYNLTITVSPPSLLLRQRMVKPKVADKKDNYRKSNNLVCGSERENGWPFRPFPAVKWPKVPEWVLV